MSNPNDRTKSSPDGRSNVAPAVSRGMQHVEDAVKAAAVHAAKPVAPSGVIPDPAPVVAAAPSVPAPK
jgi:hypothetical protein